MRILNILSGIAVLFTTLAYGHLIHHHFTHASHHDLHGPLFLTGMAVAVAAGVLSLIGACLLLKRGSS
jgi:hypothetical protein